MKSFTKTVNGERYVRLLSGKRMKLADCFSLLVGIAGLEPTVSGPPAQRFTI